MTEPHIHQPRFMDYNEDIPKGEMTFWVCRRCHVVKMYTKDELRCIRSETPICAEGRGHKTDGAWIQSYFMQRIK